MTAYTTITNAEVDQDSPVTQPLMTALRDNPLAIAEGASSAPRILVGALERLNPGSSIRSRYDAIVTTTSATYVNTGVDFAFIQAGTARFYLEHRTASGSVAADVQITRVRGTASVVVAAWSTTSTTYVARTIDLNVLPGDRFYISHRSATTTAYLQNARLQTNGESYLPGVEASVEGNTYL